MTEEDSTDNVTPAPPTVDEAGGYAALSKIVLAGRPLSQVLEEVAVLAKRVLPDTPEVSVTLLRRDHAETAAFTGTLAIHLDERQYAKGFGPCLDAAAAGDHITLVMADPDSPYPDFCRTALRQGVTHSLSVGIPVVAPTVGAVNVYSSTGQPFTDDAVRIVTMFASVAGIVLANAGLHRDLADRTAQLEAAVRSRAAIDQAKGMIMARHRCTSEEAFQILVRTSQNRNLKLRHLAEQLVDGAAQPPNTTTTQRQT